MVSAPVSGAVVPEPGPGEEPGPVWVASAPGESGPVGLLVAVAVPG